MNEIGHLLLSAEDGFVADDDAVDVAVTLGKIDHRANLALVAILIFIDPCTGGAPEPEFGCDSRNELDAARRGISANRTCERGQQFEIRTNLRGPRLGPGVRMH